MSSCPLCVDACGSRKDFINNTISYFSDEVDERDEFPKIAFQHNTVPDERNASSILRVDFEDPTVLNMRQTDSENYTSFIEAKSFPVEKFVEASFLVSLCVLNKLNC